MIKIKYIMFFILLFSVCMAENVYKIQMNNDTNHPIYFVTYDFETENGIESTGFFLRDKIILPLYSNNKIKRIPFWQENIHIDKNTKVYINPETSQIVVANKNENKIFLDEYRYVFNDGEFSSTGIKFVKTKAMVNNSVLKTLIKQYKIKNANYIYPNQNNIIKSSELSNLKKQTLKKIYFNGDKVPVYFPVANYYVGYSLLTYTTNTYYEQVLFTRDSKIIRFQNKDGNWGISKYIYTSLDNVRMSAIYIVPEQDFIVIASSYLINGFFDSSNDSMYPVVFYEYQYTKNKDGIYYFKFTNETMGRYANIFDALIEKYNIKDKTYLYPTPSAE